MLSSFKKSPVEQETIGCYSIFQVGSLSYLINGMEPDMNEMDPDILMAIKLLKELKTEKGRKISIEHIRLVGLMEECK